MAYNGLAVHLESKKQARIAVGAAKPDEFLLPSMPLQMISRPCRFCRGPSSSYTDNDPMLISWLLPHAHAEADFPVSSNTRHQVAFT
jgi:hypothetical protein